MHFEVQFTVVSLSLLFFYFLKMYVCQFCNEYAVPKDKLEYFKDVTAQEIVCSQVLKTDPALQIFFYMGFFTSTKIILTDIETK